jgi:hypothetical protein
MLIAKLATYFSHNSIGGISVWWLGPMSFAEKGAEGVRALPTFLRLAKSSAKCSFLMVGFLTLSHKCSARQYSRHTLGSLAKFGGK